MTITFSDGSELELREIDVVEMQQVEVFAKSQGWQPTWGYEAQMALVKLAAIRGFENVVRLVERANQVADLDQGTEDDAKKLAGAVMTLMKDALQAITSKALMAEARVAGFDEETIAAAMEKGTKGDQGA